MKVALIQLFARETPEQCLQQAEYFIRQAAKEGAELIILPEYFITQLLTRSIQKNGETISGPTSQLMSNLAKTYRIHIVAGSIPEVGEDSNRYNTPLVFNPNGQIVAQYRKLHLFDANLKPDMSIRESRTKKAGMKLSILDIGCNLQINIGAFHDLTIGPAHWEVTHRARAIDNQIFVAACSPARNHSARYPTWGHSMVIDPWGDLIVSAGEDEEVIYACLDYSLSQTLVFINKSLSWRDAWGLCHNNFSGYLLPHVPPASWYDDGCIKKNLEELGTFWLGQSSNFTPFIAHKGCFSAPNISSNAFKMETPSVAYCHYRCGSLRNINFGIMNKHTCICIKNKTSLTHENKEKCNEICKTPISDDEYCGGDGVVNHYRFHGEPTQPASFNFCGFVSCGDRNIQKTNCSALKGRICGDKMHQDKLPFASSRNKCGNEYLRSVDTFINCTNNTQGHFWMDIKRYEYWKPDSLKKEKIKGTTVRCLAFNSSSSVVHACRETFASVCISHSNIIDDKTPTCPQPTPQDFPTNPSVFRDNTGTGANPGIYAGISTGLVILICLSVILIVYLRRKSGEVTDKSERKSENAKAPLQITNHLEEDVYVHQAEGVYDELNKSRMKVNTNHDTNIYDTGHGDEDEGMYSKTGNNGATTGSCSEYGVCGKEVSGGEQIEDKEGMYSKMHEQVANVMQCSEYDICGTVTTCDGDISNTE